MDENNILKKKKKNYYKRHNNQNKNYYKKNTKKKKNLILENSDSEEIKNILLFNEQERAYDKEEKKEEIPIIHVEELLKEVGVKKDIIEIEDVVPQQEKKEHKKLKLHLNKNILKYSAGFAVLLVVLLGGSYSYFNYTKEDSRQADIASGEVYVRLVEDETSITLPKMYPRTDEEARSRNDNYFDFTIKGKNTSETKSVLYTININNGENVSGKTRIDREYIKIDLQEKINNEYVYIEKGVKLSEFEYTGVVLTSTTSEITKEYRLRIWIGDNVLISDTDPNATHTQAQFRNLFATYSVSVSSEDKAIAYSMFAENADINTTINFANVSSSTNGQGLYILPGTTSDEYPIYYYRGSVTNNNVIFGGYCWQMVRTTDTGGIKMVYNGEPTVTVNGNNATYDCGTTRPAGKIGSVQSTTNLNQSTGYYYADDYEIVSGSGAYITYRLKSKTNPITIVPVTSSNAGTSIPTIVANYPYTCKQTTSDGTCMTLFKVNSQSSGTTANVNMSVSRSAIAYSAFNTSRNSPTYVGYMYNAVYPQSDSGWVSNALFGSDAIWDGSDYTLVDADTTTPNATRHYSCNSTSATATCENLRYVFDKDGTTKDYIVLIGGEKVEDALYKMTGNGDTTVKTRNSNYNINTISSKAKQGVDNWFRESLTNEGNSSNINYQDYLEDTIYCNDRSFKTVPGSTTNPVFSDSGWNPNGGNISGSYLYFGTYNRALNSNWYSTTNVPSMSCPNETDRFTVSSGKGNGSLTYPVGLLTGDEIILAGGSGNSSNTFTSYLSIQDYFWLMSPDRFYLNDAKVFVTNNVPFYTYDVNNLNGLRPVVSLKLGTSFEAGGDGTPTNPYVVKYD